MKNSKRIVLSELRKSGNKSLAKKVKSNKEIISREIDVRKQLEISEKYLKGIIKDYDENPEKVSINNTFFLGNFGAFYEGIGLDNIADIIYKAQKEIQKVD